MIELSFEKTCFRDMILYDQQVWDQRVRKASPHFDAWAKADSTRYSRFLRKVDGMYSAEAVRTFIAAAEASTFTDPLTLFVDKQRRETVNFLSAGVRMVSEVMNPYAMTLLCANGAAGSVLDFQKEISSGMVKKSGDFEKNLLELCHEDSSSVAKGTAGILISTESSVAKAIDNAWLKSVGKFRGVDEKLLESLLKLKSSCEGNLSPMSYTRMVKKAQAAGERYTGRLPGEPEPEHYAKELSRISGRPFGVEDASKILALLVTPSGHTQAVQVYKQAYLRSVSLLDSLLL